MLIERVYMMSHFLEEVSLDRSTIKDGIVRGRVRVHIDGLGAVRLWLVGSFVTARSIVRLDQYIGKVEITYHRTDHDDGRIERKEVSNRDELERMGRALIEDITRVCKQRALSFRYGEIPVPFAPDRPEGW